LFERGDLKYVILELLQDKPRHGYEVIKALEERFGGFYTPSPGAVYPTLQMLEDLGYASAVERDGKRVYTITEEGRKFLADRRPAIEDLRDRMRAHWTPEFRHEMHEMAHELRDMARSFAVKARTRWPDQERMHRMRDVVSRARGEIEAILAEERGKDAPKN
jgi:DNA-binding PadR family transcriptional regulator